MDWLGSGELARELALSADKSSSFENCFASTKSTCSLEDTDGSLWYVGVIVSIVGSILSNFGVNTQKYSMIQEIRQGLKRSYVKQPIWMLGLLMVFLGAVADFGALGFAAQSLITPVGGFTMVANLFFASYWLGETITRLDLASTILIILGIVLVAAFADKSSQCFTLDNLKCLYRRKQFIAYAVVIGAAILAVYLAIVIVRRRVAKMRDKEETQHRSFARYKMVFPLLCASLSGLIGAQSVLFAKSTIEILKSTSRGNKEFSNVETYLIIIAMLVAIFGQIHWLAVGLKEFDAVIMVPVFQCVFVVFTIIGGAAYFGEFREFSKLQTIMFPVGVFVLVIGVLGLAMHKSRSAEDILLAGEVDDASSLDIEDGAISMYPAASEHSSHHSQDPARDGEQSPGSGALSPTKPLQAAASAPPGQRMWSRESRRESVHRYDEFNRLMPYGALTGRFTPALMFWNEVEGTIFNRVASHASVFGGSDVGAPAEASQRNLRRSSVPSRPASSALAPRLGQLKRSKKASLASSASSTGRDKAASFAGIEHLLSSGRSLPIYASESDSEADSGDMHHIADEQGGEEGDEDPMDGRL